jgi:hypothetical protein
MNKVIDISLIENIDKKKKTHNKEVTLLEYKKKVINDLEDVITLKFFEHKNPIEIKQTDDFINIRNKFVTFYNAYIDLNKIFMTKNAENNIMSDIIDELVSNIIYRHEHLNFTSNIKEVELLKDIIEKNNEERIKVDMEF